MTSYIDIATVFKEREYWPWSHVLLPFVHGLVFRDRVLVVTFAILWELYECMSRVMFKEFLNSNVDNENLADAALGDPLSAIVGVMLATVFVNATGMPYILKHPLIGRGGGYMKRLSLTAASALLDAIRHPLARRNRIVWASFLGLIPITAVRRLEWTSYRWDGFALGIALNVPSIAFLFFIIGPRLFPDVWYKGGSRFPPGRWSALHIHIAVQVICACTAVPLIFKNAFWDPSNPSNDPPVYSWSHLYVYGACLVLGTLVHFLHDFLGKPPKFSDFDALQDTVATMKPNEPTIVTPQMGRLQEALDIAADTPITAGSSLAPPVCPADDLGSPEL